MTTRKSRRDFIRTTAGAAAAVSAFSSTAMASEYVGWDDPVPQGSPGTPIGADEPVRIGIIGTGGMGTAHCDAFMRMVRAGSTRVRIDALCDVCEPRMTAAKKRIQSTQEGEIATYTRTRDLLARPDLHGVLIATPEHWHARNAEEALLAGKDVYVEKPMTLNLKDAMRLRKVVQKHPERIFVVGTQYVMTPSYNAVKQLIADGAIGKPVWSQTSYCRNSKEGEWLYYAIDPAWQDVPVDRPLCKLRLQNAQKVQCERERKRGHEQTHVRPQIPEQPPRNLKVVGLPDCLFFVKLFYSGRHSSLPIVDCQLPILASA